MQTHKAIGEMIGGITAQLGDKTAKITLTGNKTIVFEGEKLRCIEGYAFSEYQGAMVQDILKVSETRYEVITTRGDFAFTFENSDYLTVTVAEEIKPEIVEVFKFFPSVEAVDAVSGYENGNDTVIFQNAENQGLQISADNGKMVVNGLRTTSWLLHNYLSEGWNIHKVEVTYHDGISSKYHNHAHVEIFGNFSNLEPVAIQFLVIIKDGGKIKVSKI